MVELTALLGCKVRVVDVVVLNGACLLPWVVVMVVVAEDAVESHMMGIREVVHLMELWDDGRFVPLVNFNPGWVENEFRLLQVRQRQKMVQPQVTRAHLL